MKYFKIAILILCCACSRSQTTTKQITITYIEVGTNDTLDKIVNITAIATTVVKVDTVTTLRRRRYFPPAPQPTPPPVDTTKPPTGFWDFSVLKTQGPTVYNGISSQTIENISFTGSTTGNTVQFNNCHDIVLKHCYIGATYENCISIPGGYNITIQDCIIANGKIGVAAGDINQGGIKVINNQFLNVHGRASLSIKGGNFIQFNKVNGHGNQISGNRIEAIVGETTVEDIISVYQSANVLIQNNQIKGNGTTTNSGFMIQTGDAGGASITIDGNSLYQPVSGGISVSGGSGFVISNNRVEMSPAPTIFPSGVNWPVGIFTAACSNVNITNNLVARASTAGGPSNFNNGCTAVTLNGNKWDLTPGTVYVPANPFLNLSPADYTRIRSEATKYK